MRLMNGDLAKYLSRIILVVDQDKEWVWGIELGETELDQYKKRVVRKLDEEEDFKEN